MADVAKAMAYLRGFVKGRSILSKRSLQSTAAFQRHGNELVASLIVSNIRRNSERLRRYKEERFARLSSTNF